MASERHDDVTHRPLQIGSNLIRPATAAARLCVEEKTLAQWRSQGKGPAFIRMGRAVRYRPEDIELFIAANEAAGNKGEQAASSQKSEEKHRASRKSKTSIRPQTHKIRNRKRKKGRTVGGRRS